MDVKKYLFISVHNHNVLIDVRYIDCILQLPQLQPVPDQLPFFVGILNFHGTAIPVYDLALLLNFSEPIKQTLDTDLLVCCIDNMRFAFLFDQAVDLIEIENKNIQQPSNDIMPYVVGLYEQQHTSSWLLDLQKLLIHHQIEIVKGEMNDL